MTDAERAGLYREAAIALTQAAARARTSTEVREYAALAVRCCDAADQLAVAGDELARRVAHLNRLRHPSTESMD